MPSLRAPAGHVRHHLLSDGRDTVAPENVVGSDYNPADLGAGSDYDPADIGPGGSGRLRLAREWDLLLAIALGGVVGAEARYGVALLLPHRPGEFAWSTLVVNVSGCLLIGALMVVLLEVLTPHRLVRPFLGVGVLGGYTTFSTFAMDAQELLLAHRPGAALLFVVLSLVLGAAAVWAATRATRRLARGRIAQRVGAAGGSG